MRRLALDHRLWHKVNVRELLLLVHMDCARIPPFHPVENGSSITHWTSGAPQVILGTS